MDEELPKHPTYNDGELCMIGDTVEDKNGELGAVLGIYGPGNLAIATPPTSYDPEDDVHPRWFPDSVTLVSRSTHVITAKNPTSRTGQA